MTMTLDGTNGVTFPSWTTAGRPASPTTGMTGYNTTTQRIESYNGTAWVASSTPITYSINYLVVAGGGSGGVDHSGGGGAGGLLSGTENFSTGQIYTATVGAGAALVNSTSIDGNNGSNSVLSGSGITTKTSIGGGAGAKYGTNGFSGGSGGGGGGFASSQTTGGSGTVGQGLSLIHI
jgi:hypothetical protein